MCHEMHWTVPDLYALDLDEYVAVVEFCSGLWKARRGA